MEDRTGSANPPRGVDLARELDSDEELWWTGIRAIMQANAAGNQAIEGYLHYAREGTTAALSRHDVNTLIDSTIRYHERAIEDLQLAKAAVKELEDGS